MILRRTGLRLRSHALPIWGLVFCCILGCGQSDAPKPLSSDEEPVAARPAVMESAPSLPQTSQPAEVQPPAEQEEVPAELGPDVRVISLSPALTQIMIDMGQTQRLVGRTQFAPAGVEDVPVVGDLLHPDLERITAVKPDLLLVQPSASGVDPALQRLADARGWVIQAWRIDRLNDVFRIVEELPTAIERVGGDATLIRTAGASWRTRMTEKLVPRQSLREAGDVLMLFAVDPPVAFGEDTYLDDLLQAFGGRNAIKRGGYPKLSLEDLLALNPAVILVIAPSQETAERNVAVLRDRLGLGGEHLAIVAVDGADLLVPGTRLIHGRDALLRAFEGGVE